MNQFWEENLSEGYYDIITTNGIKKNRGLRATWHNFTNLKVKNSISNLGRHLDYACGPGTLIGNYLELESIGVDISQKQIEFASKKYKNEGLFLEIDNFSAFCSPNIAIQILTLEDQREKCHAHV